MALIVPLQQEVARENSMPLLPKLGLPSLEVGKLGSLNRKKEFKMAVVKRQGWRKPLKIKQRKVQEPE